MLLVSYAQQKGAYCCFQIEDLLRRDKSSLLLKSCYAMRSQATFLCAAIISCLLKSLQNFKSIENGLLKPCKDFKSIE